MLMGCAIMHSWRWDDLRLFLAVSREGRLIAAGRVLGLDHTTVARRLTALEGAIGSRLFDRSPRGVTLTGAGLALVAFAERMETEVEAAAAALGGQDARISGTVRLATPDAFGTYIVAPHAARLHALHPHLELELAPQSRLVSLTRREADIAVTLNRPPRGRLLTRKLTDYRLGLYASADYLARCGLIEDMRDIARHPLVWYIDELIDMPELRFLDQIVQDARPAFRSSSIVAQQHAVAGGLGLGILHVFAAEQDPRLVRLLPESVEVRRSYWLVTHADQRDMPRIRAVTAFLDALIQDNRMRF